MKKQLVIISTTMIAIVFGVSGIAAQETKKMKPGGMDMHSDPHHTVMMAYQQNVLTFAKALRSMVEGGKLADVGLARDALAEIKLSMGKMEGIRQSHMSKMAPQMRENMKPMMEKMQLHHAATSEHVLALGKVLEASTPDAVEFEKHASALVAELEKMMPDVKMKMPVKKN